MWNPFAKAPSAEAPAEVVRRHPVTQQPLFVTKGAPIEEVEHHQIACWLGEFIPPREIPRLMLETFGKTIDPSYAWQFQKTRKWMRLIDRYRQEWIVKLDEVPLYHQKYRLQRLQELLNSLDAYRERDHISAQVYEHRLLNILSRARKEVEEQPADQHSWYFTNVNLNHCTDAELIQRREELLKRIQQFRLPIRRTLNAVGDGRKIIEATGGDEEAGRGGHEAVGDAPSGAAGPD